MAGNIPVGKKVSICRSGQRDFTGFEASQEYVSARAFWVYERHKPSEHIRATLLHGMPETESLRRVIDAYTEESIEAFITGSADPFDDMAWSRSQDYIRRST